LRRSVSSYPAFLAVLFLALDIGCGGNSSPGSGSSGGASGGTPPPVAASNEWTWTSGSNAGAASGVYGTEGVAATANVPGGRAAGQPLPPGQTAVGTYGCSVAARPIRWEPWDLPTTYGSTAPQRSNGRGSAAAARYQATNLVSTGHSAPPLRLTFLAAEPELFRGSMRITIFGCSVVAASILPVPTITSTICGSSIRHRKSGRG
jgi:hypothetical protein